MNFNDILSQPIPNDIADESYIVGCLQLGIDIPFIMKVFNKTQPEMFEILRHKENYLNNDSEKYALHFLYNYFDLSLSKDDLKEKYRISPKFPDDILNKLYDFKNNQNNQNNQNNDDYNERLHDEVLKSVMPEDQLNQNDNNMNNLNVNVDTNNTDNDNSDNKINDVDSNQNINDEEEKEYYPYIDENFYEKQNIDESKEEVINMKDFIENNLNDKKESFERNTFKPTINNSIIFDNIENNELHALCNIYNNKKTQLEDFKKTINIKTVIGKINEILSPYHEIQNDCNFTLNGKLNVYGNKDMELEIYCNHKDVYAYDVNNSNSDSQLEKNEDNILYWIQIANKLDLLIKQFDPICINALKEYDIKHDEDLNIYNEYYEKYN